MSKHLKNWRERFTCICGEQAQSILVINGRHKVPFCGSDTCESYWCKVVMERRVSKPREMEEGVDDDC